MKKRTFFSSTVLLIFSALTFSSALRGQNINCFAGVALAGFAGDGGPATAAKINHPEGLARDIAGNIYFADASNNVVRKVDISGIITTVAGNPASTTYSEGAPATSIMLSNPFKLAIDAAGNLFISENGRYAISKVNTSGVITTVAGNGTLAVGGYTGDGTAATSVAIGFTGGLVVDGSGNIFFGDCPNNVVRKVDASGIISTYAGKFPGGPVSGDGGPATAATLAGPYGLALDAVGNLYIAEYGNAVIRKVSTSGIITTFAGNGTPGYSGDGGQATAAMLSGIGDVTVDGAGNVFIAEYGGNVIRKVNTSGIISTVSGRGVYGFSGDGGPATAATLHGPYGVLTNAAGDLYISDCVNNEVRFINNSSLVVNSFHNSFQPTVFPNPLTNVVHVNNIKEAANYTISNVAGIKKLWGVLKVGNNTIITSSLAPGSYNLEINCEGKGISYTKLLKE
jgi:trimeric autotransporter adhesin